MGIIIDRIKFLNYRQYGTGNISFTCTPETKLSVLIAQNGTGKTTLLNAITWCLYGKEYNLPDEKKSLPIVTSDVFNKAKNGEIVQVSVCVRVLDEDTIIEFKRSADFRIARGSDGSCKAFSNHPTLEVSTTVGGAFQNTTVKSGEEAEITVKQYFDEAIFQFYFFDGEKLRDFFSATQGNSIQNSIFNISQVTLLENACSRLSKMNGERNKKLAKDSPDIAVLNADKTEKEEALADAKKALSSSRKELQKLNARLAECDTVLKGYAPVKALQEQRSTLMQELRRVEEDEKKHKVQRVAFIREYTVLLNLYPRITSTLRIIREKEAKGDLPPAIDKNLIKKILGNPSCKCPVCDKDIDDSAIAHLNELFDKYTVSSETSNYLKEIKSSLEYFVEDVMSFKKKLEKIRQNEIDLDDRKARITNKLSEISSTLAAYESVDGKTDIAKIEKERTSILHQLSSYNQQIGSCKTIIQNCEARIAQIDVELNAAIRKMSEHEDIRKQVFVIDMLYKNFRSIKTKIMDEMKKEIETTTWKFFKDMIWKKNTFGGIKISDSYEISVYDKENTEMTGSLSATEQMALAYAFTLAIHRASGKNCPLVIDSPLGRVSDTNRENMATALKKVSRDKQIIMLFTPDEFSKSVSKIYSGVKIRELKLSEDENYVEGIEH